MKQKKNRLVIKFVALILVIAVFTPVYADAAVPETVAPMASDYLVSYTSYICAMGDGNLEIWFSVTGTGTWADIGVLTIYLYESTDDINYTWVKTFDFIDYDDETMLAHNTYYHMSHVDYEDGVPGRYYKAYVQIWAGPEDGGDTRYIWTPVERCT